jgi:uncharacterized glyoxalase superfamily protein PhnB
MPKLDAVAVVSRDLPRTMRFYEMLGFRFPPLAEGTSHVEGRTDDGGVRLMIDSADVIRQIIGAEPRPATHSVLALLCASPAEVDQVAATIAATGYAVAKAPWDAPWGQRYAILADPDGALVDLFAPLAA